jgi:hypothetical protein
MKLLPALLCGLLVTSSGAWAAAPATNAAPSAPAPANKTAANKTPAPTPATAPASAAAPAVSTVTLDDYISDLNDELKLSASEKKQIANAYVNDAPALQNILNDDTLSPLQQAQKVSDLRDARNAKIEALLFDFDRQQKYLQIEANYRVALTLLAANGGLAAAAPAAK